MTHDKIESSRALFESALRDSDYALNEEFTLELAHDCGVRFNGDMPIASVEDSLIAFAKAVLRNFAAERQPEKGANGNI